MDINYENASGTIQSIQIVRVEGRADNIFTIVKDGIVACEIVKEEGFWMEPFHGVTVKSKEFGRRINEVFVFSDNSYDSEINPVSLAIKL